MTSQQINKFIGLALSGGGSRAVAFHLGCLRALNKRGLLDKVEVLSAVSGGSVIAAMYAYSDDSFDEFDKRVLDFLRRGIQKDIALKFFLSYRVLAAIGTVIIAGTYSMIASKLGLKPLPRWTSRTDSFIEVLRSRLFKNKKVTAPTRDNLKVVFNATELKTATAFRYGNQSSSCWRYGKIHNNDIEVAEAVGASAAYPLLLPSLHRTYSFQKSDNPIEEKRVVITDGGVFDNSGVTCLEPGRNPDFTDHIYHCSHIISCNAGFGQLSGNDTPYGFVSRLKRSFETTSRKLQDSTTKRLSMYRQMGKIKTLILPYLGQQDKALIRDFGDDALPENFVTRNEVLGYPTDFAAMPEKDILKLTLRGEQLTELLIDKYWKT